MTITKKLTPKIRLKEYIWKAVLQEAKKDNRSGANLIEHIVTQWLMKKLTSEQDKREFKKYMGQPSKPRQSPVHGLKRPTSMR